MSAYSVSSIVSRRFSGIHVTFSNSSCKSPAFLFKANNHGWDVSRRVFRSMISVVTSVWSNGRTMENALLIAAIDAFDVLHLFVNSTTGISWSST
ncbi:hypothetical protein ATCV1_z032R [Acanthocystis turfacea chlorella virus 1]|uniref:Uncharacterized protein z032R n=1 Tax=Chlorovirus heliozoae TaxID=322019 RepID=A7K7Z2_9PHYC|nr:hypothetical protein ATCV1_z032R [Acanthocystis turfacea chlorella virus 1]ABT16166.1 hypothetical protein ATCV1_z032R [Acanthocystis turfacea chlorella virus 1]